MPYKNKELQKEYQRKWMAERRDEWIKENGPCVRCGSWDRLEVDHINPEDKELQPRQIWSRRQEIRDKELAKCQVLCYDCHKEKSAIDLRNIFLKNPEHGTNQKYNQGCKCDLCMEGMRVHWREYRALKKLSPVV